MLTVSMANMLLCPTCKKGGLRPDIQDRDGQKILEGSLNCSTCDAVYPVHLGIPDILPHNVLTSSEWKMWQDHLDGFQARREERIKNPTKKVNQWGKKTNTQKKFSKFINIKKGVMLDVGCGPGKLRHNFDDQSITYYGLDPIALPGVEDFPYVRALAEFIPFKDHMFTDVSVLAALDHFRDIEAFFRETIRILKPEGRLHIIQSIHEIAGPLSAVKMLSHWIKDSLEGRATKIKNPDAPKHLAEFRRSTLIKMLEGHFNIIAKKQYSPKWYSPTKLFLSLTPKQRQHH